jgi:hypothetical protein
MRDIWICIGVAAVVFLMGLSAPWLLVKVAELMGWA